MHASVASAIPLTQLMRTCGVARRVFQLARGLCRPTRYPSSPFRPSARSALFFSLHSRTRRRRQPQWAADLEALCAETADERTCLEATAYSAWMSGNLLLEKEAWREALERYSTAHRICQELGQVGGALVLELSRDLCSKSVRMYSSSTNRRVWRMQGGGSVGVVHVPSLAAASGSARRRRPLTSDVFITPLPQVGRIEDQDLFSRRVEEIEPLLRYCRYNLDTVGDAGGDAAAAEEQLLEMGRREDSGAGGDLLAAKLESVVAEARKKQASALDSVEWRGKRVAVRSETLRVALVKADELARRLGGGGLPAAAAGGGGGAAAAAEGGGGGGEGPKPGQYIKVFGAYDEALGTISQETSRLQGKGGGAKMEAHRAELEALRAYAQHHKLRLMLQRNERLVEELQEKRNAGGAAARGGERDPLGEVADIVHVYDALLQSVRNMVTNLGGGEDASGEMRDEKGA